MSSLRFSASLMLAAVGIPLQPMSAPGLTVENEETRFLRENGFLACWKDIYETVLVES